MTIQRERYKARLIARIFGCYYNSSNQQGVFYRGIPNIYRGKKLGFLVLKP
jgi:hypothetical protein